MDLRRTGFLVAATLMGRGLLNVVGVFRGVCAAGAAVTLRGHIVGSTFVEAVDKVDQAWGRWNLRSVRLAFTKNTGQCSDHDLFRIDVWFSAIFRGAK